MTLPAPFIYPNHPEKQRFGVVLLICFPAAFLQSRCAPLSLSTGRRGAPAGRSFRALQRSRSHDARHSGNSTSAASACPLWRPPHRRQKWRKRHVVPDKIHAADDIPVLPTTTPPLFSKIIARPFFFGKGTRRFPPITMECGKKRSSFRESSAKPEALPSKRLRPLSAFFKRPSGRPVYIDLAHRTAHFFQFQIFKFQTSALPRCPRFGGKSEQKFSFARSIRPELWICYYQRGESI